MDKKKMLVLRDNGGITPDRYTLVIYERNCSYFYSFSEKPNDAFGINIYCGSTENGLSDGKHWGTSISPSQAPKEVMDAMFKRYCEHRAKLISEIKAKILKYEQKPSSECTKKEAEEYIELVESLEDLAAA